MNTNPRVSPVLRVVAMALLGVATSQASAAQRPPVPLLGPHLGALFASVVEGAAERLDSSPCALVLEDFADARTGLTLAATLAASGRTASDHVRALRFERSPLPPRVGDLRLLAHTTPGGTVVYICWHDFSRYLDRRRRWYATAVVIHETLHTLGLDNDLPSSEEITNSILARCR